MSFECLKGDLRRKGLHADWELWLRAADELYLRFLERAGESPFYFHEVASVGFLASASAIAGFLPLAEYEIIKRAQHDKRIKVDGRADLWFDSGARCYSFEFKRAHVAATSKNLTDVLKQASGDIACINRDEYHYAAGGLLARVRDPHREDVYRAFAASDDVDFAYRIGPKGENGAFLYFTLVKS